MQRAKRLTKKEKKTQDGGVRAAAGAGQHQHRHIHCTACGKHLDEEQFEAGSATDSPGAAPEKSGGPEAQWLTCDHGSSFASCTGCAERTQALLAEHDRTNQPVRTADAWH